MHDQDMTALTPRSICVLPEQTGQDFKNAAGICSDFVEKYRNNHAQ